MRRLVLAIGLILVLMSTLGITEKLQLTHASPYTDIDVNIAYDMITNGSFPDLVLLDVRTKSEYDSGHIYGAVWIPIDELETRVEELAGLEDHEIIVYCLSGGRSVTASGILDSYNFTKVYNMLGGISEWESDGYPTWIATVHNLNSTYNYDTIQAAINANQTLDGHTIFIDEGTYYETVHVSKAISLVGRDSKMTIIDGNQTGGGVHIMADNVLLCNVSIQKCRTWGLNSAILIEESSNCRILDTIVINNTKGIFLFYSTNSTISGNLISNCEFSFGVHGEELIDFIHSIDSSNLVDGKPIYYLLNQTGVAINPSTHPNVGYLALVNSLNVTVEDLELTRNWEGLVCAYTNESTIRGVSLVKNIVGLHLTGSSHNTISENNLIENGFGLGIVGGGVALTYSSGNSIIGNQIAENNYYGVVVDDSSHNSIYHNCFVENKNKQILSFKSTNIWDNSVEGNYWSEYNGTDAGNDGIGDMPFSLDANNTDHYPLMGVFHSYDAPASFHVEVISNSTVDDFEYYESNNTIIMHVSNMTSNQTHGFCRVTIPHTLMNVTNIEVIIDNGTTPLLYHNYTLYDNDTHRWIYFSYPHSVHEIDIIPEFPSLLILPLFMIATLVTAIVYRRKHTSDHFLF